MWTSTSKPSSTRLAPTASSKSRASVGSMVKTQLARMSRRSGSLARAASASTAIASACASAAEGKSPGRSYDAMTDSTLRSSSAEEPTRRSMVTTPALWREGYSVMRADTTSPSPTPRRAALLSCGITKKSRLIRASSGTTAPSGSRCL